MSYRTILVHIDRSGACDARLAAAIRLAGTFKAGLIGTYLVDEVQVTPSLAALLPEDTAAQLLREAVAAEREAEAAFRRAAGAAGLSDLEWRAPSGAPLDAVVAHGRCADLVVVGQPELAEAGWSFAAQLVVAALLETGRPLLVVPSIGAPATFGSNVLVAWDGGREATRALADALPLLARAGRVTVACIDPGATARGADAPGRQRLAAYLQRHGVATRIEHQDLGDEKIDVGNWLLSRAADWGSDLLVMGGYGHPRWRERVLGGATRTLLTTMTLPVLMAH